MHVTQIAHILKPHAVFKSLHELAHYYPPHPPTKGEIWCRDTLIDPDTRTMFTKANILLWKRRLPPAGHANYCVPAEASISTQQLFSGHQPPDEWLASHLVTFSMHTAFNQPSYHLYHSLPPTAPSTPFPPHMSFKMEELPRLYIMIDVP